MANNYYEGTGVLVLDHVTPVIKALFGTFALDESHPGNGQAYIALIAETNDPRWTDVLDGLEELHRHPLRPLPLAAPKTGTQCCSVCCGRWAKPCDWIRPSTAAPCARRLPACASWATR